MTFQKKKRNLRPVRRDRYADDLEHVTFHGVELPRAKQILAGKYGAAVETGQSTTRQRYATRASLKIFKPQTKQSRSAKRHRHVQYVLEKNITRLVL